MKNLLLTILFLSNCHTADTIPTPTYQIDIQPVEPTWIYIRNKTDFQGHYITEPFQTSTPKTNDLEIYCSTIRDININPKIANTPCKICVTTDEEIKHTETQSILIQEYQN